MRPCAACKPMNTADQILALSRDPRLSPYAMSALAAWLWAPDAGRVLWSNATGAALLGAATPAALAERTFDPEEPVAAEIARLAGSLPAGWPRLEKLRAIAANFSANCSRVSLPGGARHSGDRVRSGAPCPAAGRARRAPVRAGKRSGRGVLCRRCAALCDRRARRRDHAGDARRRTPEGRRDRRRSGDRRDRHRAAHADAARQRDHDRAGRDAAGGRSGQRAGRAGRRARGVRATRRDPERGGSRAPAGRRGPTRR